MRSIDPDRCGRGVSFCVPGCRGRIVTRVRRYRTATLAAAVAGAVRAACIRRGPRKALVSQRARGERRAVIVTFLITATREPMGHTTALYDFASGLSQRGHEVHVVHLPPTNRRTGKPARSLDEMEWFDFPGGIDHHFVDDFTPAALPRADFVVPRFLDAAASEHSFFRDLGPSAPTWCGLPVQFVQGYSVFPESHHDEQFWLRCPKICVSGWLRDLVISRGVSAAEVLLIPNGIDLTKYRVEVPIADREPVIAMNYRPHPVKGSGYGIQAILAARQTFPDIRIVTFGTRGRDDRLAADIDYVESPRQDMLVGEIFNRASVFVAPSLLEGFGLCAIQAMACGCALVTTANGGSEEYAQHGKTAMVSAPRDVQTMRANIEALLENDHLRTSLATHGIEHAQSFSRERSAALLEQFLLAYREDPNTFRGKRHRRQPGNAAAW